MDVPVTYNQPPFIMSRQVSAPFNEPAPWGFSYGVFFDRTAIISTVTQALIFLKEKGVLLKDELKISQFLLTHSDLVPYLYNLPAMLTQYYGSEAIGCLNVVFEMDFPTQDQQLFFTVISKLPVDEARTKMFDMEEAFIYPLQNKGITTLTLDVDFA